MAAAGVPAAATGPAAASAFDWLAAPTTHPEEMKAAYEVRLGPLRLSAGARMTPAAVIAAGVCTGIILLGGGGGDPGGEKVRGLA
ncbi:hypothetical protein ACFSKM_24455 [Ancylobacter dichloromethanicus]